VHLRNEFQHWSGSWTRAEQWLNLNNAYTVKEGSRGYSVCLRCTYKRNQTSRSSAHRCFQRNHLSCFLRAGSLFMFETDCSPGCPLCAEDTNWNIFEKRQPVTMDLLRVYPEVTSILSPWVCCWSPSGCLDLVASIHAKNNTPSSCGRPILLASLDYFTLTRTLGTATRPIKRDSKKKKESMKCLQGDNLWLCQLKLNIFIYLYSLVWFSRIDGETWC